MPTNSLELSAAAALAARMAEVPAAYRKQVESVHEAGRTGKYPERLNAVQIPAPFDEAAWRRDPQAYLDVIEPGRVHQTAPFVPGGPTTRLVSEPTPRTSTGVPIALVVQSAPLAPVTFTTVDGGVFDNTLNSITVASDEAGMATVHYTPTPGVVHDVAVVAASPLAAYAAEVIVFVTDTSAVSGGTADATMLTSPDAARGAQE